MLSSCRMIWFLPHPPTPPLLSASCISFSVFVRIAGLAYDVRGGSGWVRSQIVRRLECLVLYRSFNTLWVQQLVVLQDSSVTQCNQVG
jgi:hypothetical protein